MRPKSVAKAHLYRLCRSLTQCLSQVFNLLGGDASYQKPCGGTENRGVSETTASGCEELRCIFLQGSGRGLTLLLSVVKFV